MTYCIDTCALIDGWKRYYPPSVFSTLWTNIESLIEEGRLIAPKEVKYELEIGGDALYKWADSQPSFFQPPVPHIQDCVGQLLDNFERFKPKPGDDIWADPYIIAHARDKNAVVVSSEKAVGKDAKVIKIPNVCQKLNIECISLLELIKKESWSF